MRRVLVLVAGIFVVIVVGFTAYKAFLEPHPRIAIGVATWPGFAPVFLARDRHYFGPLDVTIDVLDDFTARRSAYVSGRDGFTIYTIDSLAFDAGKGVDGQVVLVLDESHGADGIVARAPIASAFDLRGKKVAYTRGSPSHFFLVKYLQSAGLKIADIQSVQVDDPTRAAQAFMSGSVDAAVTWEPYLSQITQRHIGTIIASTKTMPGQIVDVLVASRAMVHDHPDLVRDVVKGWLKALDEVKTPRFDTVQIMAKGLSMSPGDFTGAAAGVAFADRAMNQYWFIKYNDDAFRADDLFDEAASIWRTENLSSAPKSGISYFATTNALDSQSP